MIYIALLRGINVGGKSKVEMSKLRDVFEKLGYTDVKTYINSGNVIFSSNNTDLLALRNEIEAEIKKDFGFSVPVVVRTGEQIIEIANNLPTSWINDDTMKCYVIFLWGEIDNQDILDKVTVNPALEDVIYLPGVLIWRIDRQNITRGNGIKLVKNEIYKFMTARNCNTVRKLADMCSIS